ncbi:MAG: dihydrodipicolinate synthase family protein [Spirochaetales bacterium]|nr:dihydrodipicolinate synthase family protein [Spirochaetales bacterium]
MVFSGIYAAMITPYEDESGYVSKKRIHKLCDFLIKSGVHGLFILGTTGEGLLLSKEERMQAAGHIIKAVDGRIPVIVHTGALSTKDTIDLTLHAGSIQADGAGIITPAFYRVSEGAILKHYTSIAREVKDFPLFVYNLPAFTNNTVSPELLLDIAKKSKNIVGIKYSSNNFQLFEDYRKMMGKDFHIFMGDDSLILKSLLMGGDGCVSGNASIYPELITKIYNLFQQEKLGQALYKQLELDSFMKIHGKGAILDHFKTILRLRGIDVGRVRSPLQQTSSEEELEIQKKITAMQIKIIEEKNVTC